MAESGRHTSWRGQPIGGGTPFEAGLPSRACGFDSHSLRSEWRANRPGGWSRFENGWTGNRWGSTPPLSALREPTAPQGSCGPCVPILIRGRPVRGGPPGAYCWPTGRVRHLDLWRSWKRACFTHRRSLVRDQPGPRRMPAETLIPLGQTRPTVEHPRGGAADGKIVCGRRRRPPRERPGTGFPEARRSRSVLPSPVGPRGSGRMRATCDGTSPPSVCSGLACSKVGDAALQAAWEGFDSLRVHWRPWRAAAGADDRAEPSAGRGNLAQPSRACADRGTRVRRLLTQAADDWPLRTESRAGSA